MEFYILQKPQLPIARCHMLLVEDRWQQCAVNQESETRPVHYTRQSTNGIDKFPVARLYDDV